VVSRLDDLPDDDLELLARAAELLDERFSL
jgi:hypothetical protein